MHDLYNIYVEGVIIREGIDEVKYLGHEDDY